MLVNATVNNSVYYPNGTLLRGGLSTEQSLGRFIYNFTLLSGAPTGTYSVDIDANYSGNEAHDILAFIATTGVNATVPEVIVDSPAVIYTNTLFDIIALTKSSGGLAADCTNNANITIRNSLNGTTVINNVAMTNFSTGLYNYTWSTGVPSTYLAIVKCMISSLSGLFVDDTEANWAAGTHNQTTAIDGNLTLALNSSMVNYTGFNFSIADQETSPQGLAFNGNRFYTIGDSSIRVYEYNLTGSYTGFNFSIAAQDTSPRGIAFNGSNFYIVGGTSVTVYEYNLTGNYTGFSFSVTAQEGSPRGIAFNGTNFYVVGDSNFTVYEYNLTGSYTGFNFSVAYQNTAPRGIAFNGTYFYVISASGIVYEYNLTGNYTGFNFSVAAQDAFAQGLAFNGTNFYVVGDDTDRVYGYSSRNYYPSGTFTSQVFNAGQSARWVNVLRASDESSAVNITFKVRSCDDITCNGESWSSELAYPVILNTTLTPDNQYFQYQAVLRTNDTSLTPVLEWTNISYSLLPLSAVEYTGMKVFSVQTAQSGGLPLNIFSSVGSSYALGDQVSIYAAITNSSGMLVNATVNNSVYYPNGTLLRGGLSTEQSLGVYNFSFTLSSSAPLGTYSIRIDANYSGNEVHDILAFIVTTTPASGGLPLNIFSSVGSSYALGDQVSIYATITNSSGMLVNATVNNSVYYPNGTLLRGGLSTEQSLGRFIYNFTLLSGAPTGTYSVDIDDNYSGNEAHDILAFIATTGVNATVPEVIVDTPAVIYTNTLFDIIALTKSSSGLAADCTNNANITIRNSLNGTTVINNVVMTNFSTGLYNYTWSTGVPSTYLAIVKCMISSLSGLFVDDT